MSTPIVSPGAESSGILQADLATTNIIELSTDAPVSSPTYKVVHADSDLIEKEIRDMLDKEIIEHLISPCTAGVTSRWCQKSTRDPVLW